MAFDLHGMKPVADGTGRDISIFRDGQYYAGRNGCRHTLSGTGWTPVGHPIFSVKRRSQPLFEPALAENSPAGRIASASALPQRRRGAEGEIAHDGAIFYNIRGGVRALLLPKQKGAPGTAMHADLARHRPVSVPAWAAPAAATRRPAAARRPTSVPDLAASAQGWRSRETMTSFDCWRSQLPVSLSSPGGTTAGALRL
eukprot:TRINITY_DN10282_c0_g1_i1.p1 TRINITY_DN10282_c0_g1~~TRINITY_DN10282_c0_g1_i1.p1  ORF type:complete len:199 (+),score=26.77 TRINITY_DN10282_c0_g1_i1:61-657(+)